VAPADEVSAVMLSPGEVTPRARALMALNEDFRAGRVSKEEKLRRKQDILNGTVAF